MKSDYQGLGVYQRTQAYHNQNFGTGYESIDRSGKMQNYDNYVVKRPIGSFVSIPGGFTGDIPTAVGPGNLVYVDLNAKPGFITFLDNATFFVQELAGDPLMGTAVATFTPDHWIGKYSDSVIMLGIDQVSVNHVPVAITKDPSNVSLLARQGAGFAILNGPQNIINAAAGAVPQPAPSPEPKPSGTTPQPSGEPSQMSPVVNDQSAAQQTQLQQQSSQVSLPKWVIPAIAGTGVIAVIAILAR